MRDKILKAAMEIAEKEGIRFTMADLANDLRISKRTLYENFGSKEELITAVVETLISGIREMGKETFENPYLTPVEKLRIALGNVPDVLNAINFRILNDLKRFYPDTWTIINNRLDSDWDIIVSLIQDGISQGQIRETNPQVVAHIFIGAIREFLNYSILEKCNTTFSNALKTTFNLILSGLISNENNIHTK